MDGFVILDDNGRTVSIPGSTGGISGALLKRDISNGGNSIHFPGYPGIYNAETGEYTFRIYRDSDLALRASLDVYVRNEDICGTSGNLVDSISHSDNIKSVILDYAPFSIRTLFSYAGIQGVAEFTPIVERICKDIVRYTFCLRTAINIVESWNNPIEISIKFRKEILHANLVLEGIMADVILRRGLSKWEGEPTVSPAEVPDVHKMLPYAAIPPTDIPANKGSISEKGRLLTDWSASTDGDSVRYHIRTETDIYMWKGIYVYVSPIDKVNQVVFRLNGHDLYALPVHYFTDIFPARYLQKGAKERQRDIMYIPFEVNFQTKNWEKEDVNHISGPLNSARIEGIFLTLIGTELCVDGRPPEVAFLIDVSDTCSNYYFHVAPHTVAGSIHGRPYKKLDVNNEQTDTTIDKETLKVTESTLRSKQ